MNDWLVGEAKQRFSEVLRRSAVEPQRIFKRDRLVAAVIAVDTFDEFEKWAERRRRRTLGEAFDEVRELCEADNYELDTGPRRDRAEWITDSE